MSSAESPVSSPKPASASRAVRILTAFLSVTAVTALAVLAYKQTSAASGEALSADNEADDETSALPVDVIQPERLSWFTTSRSYAGIVKASKSTRLSFERPARVVEISVDEGDYVTTGTPLAKLDTRRVESLRTQLLAEIREAQAQLTALEDGPRDETIRAARSERDAVAAEAELAERIIQRTQRLFERKATDQRSLDQAELQWKAVQSRLAAAENRLEELTAGTRAESIQAQAARVESLQARLAQTEIDISDSTLTAPFTGRVQRRLADEGTFAGPAVPILELVSIDDPEAHIGIPEARLPAIRNTDYLNLTTATSHYTGRLKGILPQVDARTRTRQVVIHFPHTSRPVDETAATDTLPVAGEFIRLHLDIREETDGFRLPRNAVRPGRRGLWVCYAIEQPASAESVSEERTVQSREVEILETLTDSVIVRGAIFETDLIVAAGTHRIVPGQAVVPRRGLQKMQHAPENSSPLSNRLPGTEPAE